MRPNHRQSGTQLYILSFDHTTGKLVIDGTGTVSADGLTVTTDPGSGVTQPGWHGMTPPGSDFQDWLNTAYGYLRRWVEGPPPPYTGTRLIPVHSATGTRGFLGVAPPLVNSQNAEISLLASEAYALEGAKWNFGSGTQTITYSFASQNFAGQPLQFQGSLSATFEDQIRAALAQWGAAAGINFQEVTDSSTSDIRLGIQTPGFLRESQHKRISAIWTET